MTDTVRVPREPTEAMLANGREALMPLVRLDSYGPLIGLWQDMLAASPQGESDWITHDGGPNPVPGKMVQVRFEVGGYADKASDDLRWTYDRGGYDIIAYRVTEGVNP